jgi:hypothetical protein
VCGTPFCLPDVALLELSSLVDIVLTSITTRSGMAEALEDVMNSSYAALKEDLRLTRRHSLLKTYFIEAHTSRGADDGGIYQFLKTAFEVADGASKQRSVVTETKEERFFVVQGSAKRSNFIFFIDAADPRFWITHSVSNSDISDLVINSLVTANSSLDSAWMPMELLEKVLTLGESRGLGLDFDRRYIDRPVLRKGRSTSVDQVGQYLPDRTDIPLQRGIEHLESVKMQLWGSGSDRILGALRAAGLGHSTTLSKVRLRTEQPDDHDAFSLADLKYDGKVTGRGTSFASYSGFLLDVLGRYSSSVRSTEKRFSLRWEQSKFGSGPSGEPLYIHFDGTISNLEQFCIKVFSGAEPFKLIGLPIRRNDRFYTVSAIDLHVNQRVDFEVSPDHLRIFLPAGTCGNSILRIYTNLQHFFSSGIKAIDGTGTRIFNF